MSPDAVAIADALEALRQGDWQRAHAIVQQDEGVLASWAHGIVHVLEGDRANARYWYGRAHREWPEPFDVSTELAALEAACAAPRPR